MKQSFRNRILKTSHAALTVILVAASCFCASYATAASDEKQGMTDQSGNPVKNVMGGIEDDYEKADARHEDIIDRAFAPLEDTVSDINRDLNDGSSDSEIPQTSD